MQINNISQQQPVFGKLVSGKNLRKTLAPDRQDLINKYNVIRLYIRRENLHKINNADIILDYSDIHGFYGMIKTKSQYLAANLKDYYCKVNTSQKALQNFKEWAIKWQQKISQ